MNKKAKVIDKDEFFETSECDCGKPLFKFHNTSKNMYVMKCAYTKYELDIKTRKWVLSKKQPCKIYNVYHDTPPTFIKNEIIEKDNVILKVDFEKRLRQLFDFLFVTNRTSIIQEIDLIVKNNLKREPRKIFYYPSIGNLRVSHREPLEDYRNRIFSEKIINYEEPVVSILPIINITNEVIEDPDSGLSESEAEDSESGSEYSEESESGNSVASEFYESDLVDENEYGDDFISDRDD